MLPLRSDSDVVRARQAVRSVCAEMGLSLVDRTKTMTAASELARNTVVHGRGGTMTLEAVEDGSRKGVRMTFEDEGPGISDVQQALKDGFTTGAGMGLGRGGSRRLVSEFDIASAPGRGTRVVVIRWGEVG